MQEIAIGIMHNPEAEAADDDQSASRPVLNYLCTQREDLLRVTTSLWGIAGAKVVHHCNADETGPLMPVAGWVWLAFPLYSPPITSTTFDLFESAYKRLASWACIINPAPVR